MMQEFIFKGNGIGTTMSWNTDNPLYFRVIEKSTGNELPIKYEADPMGFVHTFNAYEDDGYIGFVHPIFRFWTLLATKLPKYENITYVIFFYIWLIFCEHLE